MKKLAAVALAAVLSFGCAAPAFAAGPHHGVGRCLNYSGICQGVAQKVLAPGLRSLNERLGNVLAQVSETGAQVADAGAGYGRGSGFGTDTNATSPSLCANGACGLYLDADGDGVCDYHGENCTNMGGARGTNCPTPNSGGNYVNADGDGVCDNYGTYRQGTGNSSGDGASYGGHHGGGHHGRHCR